MSQLYFQFAIEYQAVVLSDRNDVKIAKGQVALLAALLGAKDHCGTLDNATADLSYRFEDDGKWRGQVTLGLFLDGLIDRVGAENSKRKSRNRGLLRKWRLLDEQKARQRIDSLRRLIESIENPRTAATDRGQVISAQSESTGKDSSSCD